MLPSQILALCFSFALVLGPDIQSCLAEKPSWKFFAPRALKEAPLCNRALYQEYNPCDDYLDTILTEPSLSQKKNLELNSFCLQEARAQCLGLYQCSRRCYYCLRLQNIDGWCVPEISQGCYGSNLPNF